MKVLDVKKAMLKMGVLAAMVGLSINVNAHGDFSLIKSDNGEMVVALKDVQAKTVNVFIEDANEKVVYTSKIKGEKVVSKTFDLTKLENGTYFLIAEYGDKILKKEFSVKDAMVIAQGSAVEYGLQPVFRNSNDGLIVFFQSPSKENVEVAFKSDMETFFTHAAGSKVATKFNTTNLPEGDYQVELTVGKNVYSYKLEL